MTYEEFIDAVASRSGFPKEQAESLTRATLSTLADRLTSGEADDVASQLPKELKSLMISGEPQAKAWSLEEFLEHVARRADVSTDEAERGARAVMTTLRQALNAGEFKDMMAQLPKEYSGLVDATVPPSGP